MSKKYKPNDGDPNHIFHMSSEEATLRKMPKFYSSSRCGIIGDTFYNRRKFKQETKKILSTPEEW